MKDKARFWDKLADRYAAQPISDMQAYKQKLAAIRVLMRPDMQVLEFGSGTGGTAIQLAPYVATFNAYDLSPRMIEISCAQDGAAKVDFEVADFDTTRLESGAFDMILGFSILHLVPNPSATIARAFAALKPGGFLITSTACMGKMWYLNALAPIGQAIGKMPPLSYFTNDQLVEMLTTARFQILEQRQVKKNGSVFIIALKPTQTVDA